MWQQIKTKLWTDLHYLVPTLNEQKKLNMKAKKQKAPQYKKQAALQKFANSQLATWLSLIWIMQVGQGWDSSTAKRAVALLEAMQSPDICPRKSRRDHRCKNMPARTNLAALHMHQAAHEADRQQMKEHAALEPLCFVLKLASY